MVDEQPRTKAEVLILMRQGRERLTGLLAKFSDAEKIALAVQDNWTVKDIMAHIASWESACARWIEAGAQGRDPGVPALTQTFVDTFNAENYARNRERALADVQAEFERANVELTAAVQSLPDDPDDAKYSVWGQYKAPWRLIGGNNFGHYEEHYPALINWLKANGRE